jgi:hypothetical protein
MWALEAVQGLEPGSPAEAGAGRDRQSDRDLTLGWVSDYESGVCKVKKEIPGKGSSKPLKATLPCPPSVKTGKKEALPELGQHRLVRRLSFLITPGMICCRERTFEA